MILSNEEFLKEHQLLAGTQAWNYLAKWYSVHKTREDLVDKVLIFGHFILGNYMKSASPQFHRDIVSAFFSNKNEFIAAPRGFAKTTMMQICITYSILNKMDEFIVLIEKTFNEAAEVVKGVRDIFETNDMIRMIYGNLINMDLEGLAQSSKNPDARGDVFINGVRLRAKGFATTPRGLKSGASRPTRIILDDVEDDEHIDNEEQRLKYRDFFVSAVVPAVSREGHGIKMFGTILHNDSLLANLIEKHKGKIYRAFYCPELDSNYYNIKLPDYELPQIERTPFAKSKVKLLWGEYWDWKALMAKREDMVLQGQSNNKFFQEYRNEPTAEEERSFKADWLWRDDRRIMLSKLLKSGKDFVIHAKIDCADTTSSGADWTSCVVHMIDSDHNWYRVDVFRAKLNMNEQVNLIFDVWQRWHLYGSMRIGVEKKGFIDQIKPYIDEEQDRRGVYVSIEELRPMGRNKLNRIVGALQGRYEHGKIWTCTDDQDISVGNTEDLLNELYDLGKAKHDDLADAEAYEADMIEEVTNKMLNEEAPYFEPSDDPFNYSTGHFKILDPYT